MPFFTASRLISGESEPWMMRFLMASSSGHDLEDAGAAEVAGVAAFEAAFAFLHLHPLARRHGEAERRDLFRLQVTLGHAVRADAAHEALGHGAHERSS